MQFSFFVMRQIFNHIQCGFCYGVWINITLVEFQQEACKTDLTMKEKFSWNIKNMDLQFKMLLHFLPIMLT